MSNLQRSSHVSATCQSPTESFGGRLEWRPSRLLVAAMLALGALGAAAVLASEMPRAPAWLLAGASLVHGVRRAAELRRLAPVSVFCDARTGTVAIDGVPVADPGWHWRGPVAFLRWRDRDGRRRMLAFWPDVLDASRRRELRLAAGSAAASRSQPSMAP